MSGTTTSKPSIEELTALAYDAATRAHCPYSGFHVGAALVAGGKVYTGCNIESASYGLTVCAERVAIFKAVSDGHTKIDHLVVVTPDSPDDAPKEQRMSCGACRQIIAEFMAPGGVITIDKLGDFTVEDLLPTPFVLST